MAGHGGKFRRFAGSAALALLASGCIYIARDSPTAVNGSDSRNPALSGDGRYTAFESRAPDLVGGDTNGRRDIFRHDHLLDVIERVSVASTGAQATGDSSSADISESGNRVVFASSATDLIPTDTNGVTDIFSHVPSTGSTIRLSASTTGTPANGGSGSPSVSPGGGGVAFVSSATNLVAGDTNGVSDIFLRRFSPIPSTIRVSVTGTGAQTSGTASLPDVEDYPGAPFTQYLVAFQTTEALVPNDTNGVFDAYVFDTATGVVTLGSVALDGDAPDQNALFTGVVPKIAASGGDRFLMYTSFASDIVAGDTNLLQDVFVRDLVAGTTERVSVAPNGSQLTENSFGRAMSADGRYIAFSTTAAIDPADTDGTTDVYIRDRVAGRTWIASTPQDGMSAGVANSATLSHDGIYLGFQSTTDFTGDEAGEVGADNDVYFKLALRPELDAVVPSTMDPGTTETFTLHGAGFRPGTTVVQIVPGITVDSVTFVDESRLSVQVTAAPGTASGFVRLWVRVPGNGFDGLYDVASTDCTDCIFVT